MSITRCGSARSWVNWPTATAAWPRSWPSGAGAGRDARARAVAHRSALSAGGRSARRRCDGGLAGGAAAAGCAGGPWSTTRPVSWSAQAALAVLLSRRSAPAAMWRWGSRSPGAAIRRWMSWWLPRQHLGAAGRSGRGFDRLPSCWPRCASVAWPPTSTKMCPLRCWWSGSTRPRSLTHHAPVSSGIGLAEQQARETLALGDLQVRTNAGGHPHHHHGPDIFPGRAFRRHR